VIFDLSLVSRSSFPAIPTKLTAFGTVGAEETNRFPAVKGHTPVQKLAPIWAWTETAVNVTAAASRIAIFMVLTRSRYAEVGSVIAAFAQKAPNRETRLRLS